MVTQNLDVKSQKLTSPVLGTTVRVCAILAWVTLLTGCASIFWNNQLSLRGGEWADRAANGSAICVGLIYVLSFILTLWGLTKLVMGRLSLHLVQFYFVSIVPLVLVVWGILESRFSNASEYNGGIGIVRRLIDLDKLAHHRLLGGSLWQPSVNGRSIRMIGSESTEISQKVVEQLDTFVDQIRQVATGESSTDAIRLHTRPVVSALVLDTANWVNFANQQEQSDALSNDQWRVTAVAAIDAGMSSATQPPSFFRLGFIEYFSCNTDDLMDAYFEARSESEFFPALGEFLNEINYATTSAHHASVGAVFVTYLLEDRNIENLSTLWKSSNREEFRLALETLVGKDFEKIEIHFETWLRSEADRLGWDRQKVFHSKVAASPADQIVDSELVRRLSSFQLGKGVLVENWNALCESCEALHRRRLENKGNLAVEISTKQEVGDSAIDVITIERIRILRRNNERIYAHTDINGERAIAITATNASQSERKAQGMQRNTRPITTEQERAAAESNVDHAITDWFLQADFIAEIDRHLSPNKNWRIERLSNGGTEAPWLVTFVAKDATDESVEFKIDPTKGYSVTRVSIASDKTEQVIERRLTQLENDYVIAEETATTGDRSTSMDPKNTRTNCQIMSELKVGSFSEEMGYMMLKTSKDSIASPVTSNKPWTLSFIRGGAMLLLSLASLSVAALATRSS